MSKGWRARLRRKLCAHCRAARACKVAKDRRDDRQASLFAAAPSLFAAAPSLCSSSSAVVIVPADYLDVGGCRPRARLIPWCEVLEPSERVAVRAALLELRAAAAGDD